MNKLHIAFLTLALMAVTGCSQQTFIIDDTARGRTATAKEMQSFFIGGIGQEKTIYVSDICRSNERVVKVEAQLSVLDFFISLITFPIYTPRTARVYCAENKVETK